MQAFNAILIGGLVGGTLFAFLWHLLALLVGFGAADSYTWLAFLVGWITLGILILKA